jgi:nucleoside-diphosphate-sugar epimerase
MSHFGGLSGLPGMTNSSKAVLLAGATGVFGRHIVRVLTEAGYQVTGIGRGAGNELRADLNDREQVLAAVRGYRADIVIHAATALKRPPARHRDMTATDTLRTVGMRNLVDAARAVGASRFVTESMVFGYGYGPQGTSPEFGRKQSDPRVDAHVAAMRIKEELTFGTPGIDGVSLRFGLFYGPGGTEGIVRALKKRQLPAPPSHGRVLPWVQLEDAATAILAAIEHGRPGEAYDIVDDTPTGFGDHIRLVAAAYRTPKPLAVPAFVLSPLRLMSAMLHTDLRLDNAKARTELGWTPAYASAAAWLAEATAGDRATLRS